MQGRADNTDSCVATTVKPPNHSPSTSHHPITMVSGAYSQFCKMDSDEIYAAAIQDLQEIFSLKVGTYNVLYMSIVIYITYQDISWAQ